MNLGELIGTIHRWLSQFVPVFRTVWAITVILGIIMLVTAFVLKKNPARKKSPWIVGTIAILMVVSSATQLIASLL